MSTIIERDLLETSRIWTMPRGKYKLRAYKGIEFAFHLPRLKKIVAELSREVHAISERDAAEEVVYNMSNGGSIVIATLADSQEAVGYSTQRILQPTIGVNRPRVMYISTRAVRTEHQKGGLGTALLQYANSLHAAPDIIGGRTQNPVVVRSYYQSGLFSRIYPFDRTYDQSQSVQAVLRYIVLQTRNRFPLDERTGLVREVYKEGKSRAYDNAKASPEIQALYTRMMQEFGLEPDRGDALHVTGITKGRLSFLE